TSAGATAKFSANVSLSVPNLASVTPSTVAVEVNTQPVPVVLPGDTDQVPAGPFVQVVTSIPKTTLSNGASTLGSIAGDLLFQQEGSTTVVGLANLSIWIGAGTDPTVTGGEGLLVINPNGNTGIAGYVSGAAAAGASGFTIGGQLLVEI